MNELIPVRMEVWAPSRHLACEAFRMVHSDKTPGILNCADVYPAEEFEHTIMAGLGGNFGFGCRETITMNITVERHGGEVTA